MTHVVGDSGHTTDHNTIEASLAGKLNASTAAATYAPITGSTSYAPLTSAQLAGGIVWGFLGDSITFGSGSSNAAFNFVTKAVAQTGGLVARPDSINAGHAGEATAAIVARLAAFTAAGPQAWVLMAGENDAGGAVSVATFAANMVTIFQTLKPLGPGVVCTVTPRASGATAAIQRLILAYNDWIRTNAPAYGLTVADTYAAVVDTTTGYLTAAYDSGDGIHPSDLGHTRLAQTVAAAMKTATLKTAARGLVRSISPAGVGTIDDPLNTRATVVSGLSWYEIAGGTGTAPVYSMVNDATGFLPAGRWAQMDFTGTAGGVRRLGGQSATVAAGDKLLLAAHLQIEDVSGTWLADTAAQTTYVAVSVVDPGNALITTLPIAGIAGTPDPVVANTYNYGPIVWPFTVPAATTFVTVWFSLVVATGKHIKMRVGAADMLNLTTRGDATQYAYGTSIVSI